MPKFELQKVAFVNPNDLTETVVLSTILEGAGGATRSFVEEEAESYVTEDNQEIKDSQVYTFTMAGKPTADLAQLTTWAENGTKLTICGYAYNEGIQIDNAIITRLQDSSERLNWKITAKKAGAVGYDSNGKLDTEFMMSKNLLNMYYWQEGATSGLAAGWDVDAVDTVSFSLGKQTFTQTSTSAVPNRTIYFPFSGKTVTARFEAESITGTVPWSIRALDNSGTTLSQNAKAVSSGVNSATLLLPDETHSVRIRFSVGSGDEFTFFDPAINIGTSTNYISQ